MLTELLYLNIYTLIHAPITDNKIDFEFENESEGET